LSRLGFGDRQALNNVIVPMDAVLQPIGILFLHRTSSLAGMRTAASGSIFRFDSLTAVMYLSSGAQ
jgi:hypothetical protein